MATAQENKKTGIGYIVAKDGTITQAKVTAGRVDGWNPATMAHFSYEEDRAKRLSAVEREKRGA